MNLSCVFFRQIKIREYLAFFVCVRCILLAGTQHTLTYKISEPGESLSSQACSQENHKRQKHHEKQLTKKIWVSKSCLAQIWMCH